VGHEEYEQIAGKSFKKNHAEVAENSWNKNVDG